MTMVLLPSKHGGHTRSLWTDGQSLTVHERTKKELRNMTFSLSRLKVLEALASDEFSAECDYFRIAEIIEETQLAHSLKQQHPKGNAWYVSAFCGWF